jgi:uncharacterized protein (DUF697 family)
MIGRGLRLFGTARWFWDAVKEINPADVKADLDAPLDIAVYGRPGSGRTSLVRALFGAEAEGRPQHGVATFDLGAGAVAAGGPLDLAILALDASQPDWSDERRVAHQVEARGVPLLLVLTHADALERPEQGRRAMAAQFPGHPPELQAVVDPRDAAGTRIALVQKLLDVVPSRRLALAHRFPTLRRAVAEDLIREASRVNGQFALVSALPSAIPLLGFFVGGMADTLILTKNQAMLVFKLAGIYGRDIDDRFGVMREILPVIGSAFIWRTLARTAVGALAAPGGPTAAFAALPKAAVAFMGTYAVGEAARYYYERGKAPPPEAYARFREDAQRLYGEVNAQLKALLASRAGGSPPPNGAASAPAPAAPDPVSPTPPAPQPPTTGAAPPNR